MSFNITPVASGYQEIHPYSAMTIDSVKINISLIMMKEWPVLGNDRDSDSDPEYEVRVYQIQIFLAYFALSPLGAHS